MQITLFKLYDRDICALPSSRIFANLTYDVSLEAESNTKAVIIDSSFVRKLFIRAKSLFRF
ncbi:hypothetical protein [Terrisporobacter sp.]